MAKSKSRKVSPTEAVTKTPPVGFAVKYQGFGSTIQQQPVKGKAPKNVFSSLPKAKKALVSLLKADIKKDLARISKLSGRAGNKTPTKTAKKKKAPTKTTTAARAG